MVLLALIVSTMRSVLLFQADTNEWVEDADVPLGKVAMGEALAESTPFLPAESSTGATKALSGDVEEARSYRVMGCSVEAGDGVLNRVASCESSLSSAPSRPSSSPRSSLRSAPLLFCPFRRPADPRS
jgi:hypothetical protein